MVDAEGQRVVNAATEERPWEPLTPEQVRDLFKDAAFPWWIGGGWALDLFLGHATRAHATVDVATFRDDVPKVRDLLKMHEFALAQFGTLTPWPKGELPDAAHTLWARERGQEPWRFEVLVEERRGDRWAYRRNTDVGVRAADIGRKTSDGIPYIRPEIQLLYKSKDPRPVDETDFITLLPHLDAAQKAFLSAGIWATNPGHRWLARLK